MVEAVSAAVKDLQRNLDDLMDIVDPNAKGDQRCIDVANKATRIAKKYSEAEQTRTATFRAPIVPPRD
jgi:hypothetical protein